MIIISETMVIIVVGVVIAVLIAALTVGSELATELLEMIDSHLLHIEIILIVISVLFAIVNIVVAVKKHKKVIFPNALSLIANIIGCSQLIFFFHNSFLQLFAMKSGIFQFIIFVIWLVYTLVNVAITYFAQVGCIGEVVDNDDLSINLLAGGAGVVGWIINIILFVLL